MSWFRKRKPQTIETIKTEVHLNTLARWYSYDAALNDPNAVAKVLDLLPVSEEGKAQESLDSARRVTKVAPLFAFATVVANINAKAVASLQMEEIRVLGIISDEQIESETERVEEMYSNIGFSAILSALSSGVELGLLTTDALEGYLVEQQ